MEGTYIEGFRNDTVLTILPPRIIASSIIPNIHNSLSSSMQTIELDVNPEPPMREQFGVHHIRYCEGIVDWRSTCETKRRLVCFGKEADESGQHMPEWGRSRRKGRAFVMFGGVR